jgi:ABC-type branched-subunit amino acid transport system ATPase component
MTHETLTFTVNGDQHEHKLTGRVLWISGPNGSGKSTFCAALSLATTGTAHDYLWRDAVKADRLVKQGGITAYGSTLPRGRDVFREVLAALVDAEKFVDFVRGLTQKSDAFNAAAEIADRYAAEAKGYAKDEDVLRRYGALDALRVAATKRAHAEQVAAAAKTAKAQALLPLQAAARVDAEAALQTVERMGFFRPGSLVLDHEEGIQLCGNNCLSDTQRRILAIGLTVALDVRGTAPIIPPDIDWDAPTMQAVTRAYLCAVDVNPSLPLLVIQSTSTPPGRVPAGVQRIKLVPAPQRQAVT